MKNDKDLLKNGDTLQEFIQQATQTEEFQQMQQKLTEGLHPDADVLYDIALGQGSDEDVAKWQTHIDICPVCGKMAYKAWQVDRERRGIEDETPITDWREVAESLRERAPSLTMSIKSFAERPSLITRHLPVGEFAEGEGPTASKSLSYRALVGGLVRTTRFTAGEPMTLRVKTPSNGYLQAFLIGSTVLLYPSASTDDIVITANMPKEIQFRAPETPGDYRIDFIWSKFSLIDPKSVDFGNLKADPALLSFASFIDGGEMPPETWGVDSLDIQVAPRTPAVTLTVQAAHPPKVMAIRTKPSGSDPTIKDWDYWRGELFRELTNGRARFGWSGSDKCDLSLLRHKTPLDPDEQEVWNHSKFLLDLEPGDLLFYVNIPNDQSVTVIEVGNQDDYQFTGVWDYPKKLGDYRHKLHGEYLGVFERGRFITDLLAGSLKVKRSHWSLDKHWGEIADLLNLMEP